MNKQLLLFLFTIIYSASTFSQTGVAEENEATAKSFFKTSLSYLSNAVYQGRKDSAVISYITPALSYVNKNGWNISGSFSYSPNSGINEIELITVETGYEHKFSKSFSANAFAAAYFYNQFSSAVQSETNGGIGIGIDYAPKNIINLSADLGTTISSSPDIATTLSIGHPFYFGAAGHDWGIIPAVACIAGTQVYYNNYYTNRKFSQAIRSHRGKGRGIPAAATSTNTINVVSAETFKVLDYELSVQTSYDATKWGIFFTPIYAIPVHPLTFTEQGSATPMAEKLSNSFYFTLGAYVKF